MNKQDYNNAMRLESYDLATFAKKLYELNGDNIWNALSDSDYKNAKRVIATGCGDSYCAGLAAKPVFEELAGVRAFGLTAMDVSRFFDGRDFDETLFFGVSSRGRTSRVVEAAMRVKELGAGSVNTAVVNAKINGSELEKECNRVVHVELPEFECGEFTEMAPYQRRYFSTVFTLMLFAVRMGLARGNYTEAKAREYIAEMIGYAARFDRQLMDSINERMWELAQRWSDITEYEVVASSSQMATAWFSAAKPVEAFGAISTYDDAANWLAVNSRISGESIVSVLYINREDAQLELLTKAAHEMAKRRERLIIITDIVAADLPASAEVFVIPTSELLWARPLMQYCPLGCLLGYIAKLRGANFYRRGPGDIHAIKKINSTISESIVDQPLVLVR